NLPGLPRARLPKEHLAGVPRGHPVKGEGDLAGQPSSGEVSRGSRHYRYFLTSLRKASPAAAEGLNGSLLMSHLPSCAMPRFFWTSPCCKIVVEVTAIRYFLERSAATAAKVFHCCSVSG